jgi:prepilin peptidase CpaA
MGLLAGFLLAAVLTDTATRKIPNKLVLAGIIAGLLCQAFLPEGNGLISSLKGLVLGFALFLPMYLLRVMGAGDVKLIAMVGVFTGSPDIYGVALCTLLAGGVLSLLFTLRLKASRRMFENIKLMMLLGMAKVASGKMPVNEATIDSVGTLPYALAIALGTASYFIWHAF